jgi:hypothetical protein
VGFEEKKNHPILLLNIVYSNAPIIINLI